MNALKFFDIPKWARYVASDASGEIFVYEKEPFISEFGAFWDCPDSFRSVHIGDTYPEFRNKNWKESLQEITRG